MPVEDLQGVAGQNSPNPVSTFNNHVLVRIGDRYYDPSYGLVTDPLFAAGDAATATQALLAALQNQDMAGSYKARNDGANRVFDVEAWKAVTKDNLNVQLKLKEGA
jgi:hypothetical protein